jgi:hypothetical protein|eukprot:COSAG01_NODE_3949_length_5502_cov_53.650750_4_plen_41_part_00
MVEDDGELSTMALAELEEIYAQGVAEQPEVSSMHLRADDL